MAPLSPRPSAEAAPLVPSTDTVPLVPSADLLYVDDHIVATAKPSGLLVHRSSWAEDDSAALQAARDAISAHVYPVHRLDRGASGVLLFARSSAVARALHELFESGAVTKRYLVLVRGRPPDYGLVEHAIPRREGGPRVPAATAYARLQVVSVPVFADETCESHAEPHAAAASRSFSLVEAVPRTGRLHQLRRHFKHLGHPVVGDANYGRGELNRLCRDRFGLARLALHARELAFTHPITGARLRLVAPMPDDLATPLARMGFSPVDPP